MNFTLSLFSADPNPAKNKHVESTVCVGWDQIPELITSRNWSPAIFDNYARNLANYRGHMSLYGFDIDSGMTLEDAKLAFKDYQCILGTTRNHQKIKHPGAPNQKPACDRFRGIFVLSEPIKSSEDFKATFEAYSEKYPFDPQTNNAAGFFYKCKEIVFKNDIGKLFIPVKSDSWNELKTRTFNFEKDDKNSLKGVISRASQEFLDKGAVEGLFNGSLFKCAVDHLEQKYTEQEFLGRLHESIQRGVILNLDQVDRSTIRSAFNREPKYGARVQGRSHIDAQKVDITNRIMDGEFIQVVLKEGTSWYGIRDYENKEVESITNRQIIERHISSEIKKPENHYNSSIKGKDHQGLDKMVNCTKQLKIEEVFTLWKHDGSAIAILPEPILWRGVEGWCNKRFNFDLIPGQPHPAWDEFLNRLSEPEVFKAWVFSCFVPKHETRQAMWLYGSNGQDGKTKIIEAIAEPFGQAQQAISEPQVLRPNQFTLSGFLGKRLATYSDCKTPRFTDTSFFRNLTGGDLVTIEMKGGAILSGILKLKVLVGSNSLPHMSHANFDQSRVIIIEVSPSQTRDDPTWPERLKSEFPAFLGDCQEAFKRLCPNNGNIILPETIQARNIDAADIHKEDFQNLFDQFFEIAPINILIPGEKNLEDWVSGVQMFNLMAVHGYRSAYELNQAVHSITQFLETKFGIKKRRKSDQKFYYFGLKFRDPGQAETFQKRTK